MKSILSSKKGQLGSLAPAMLSLIFAGIVLVFGVVMSQELRDTQVTNTAACNSTDTSACGEAYDGANATVAGLGTFADFWEIIVLAIVIIISIVNAFFFLLLSEEFIRAISPPNSPGDTEVAIGIMCCFSTIIILGIFLILLIVFFNKMKKETLIILMFIDIIILLILSISLLIIKFI